MLLSILSNLTSWNMVPSIYFAMMNLKSIFITISLDISCRTKTERFKTEHLLKKIQDNRYTIDDTYYIQRVWNWIYIMEDIWKRKVSEKVCSPTFDPKAKMSRFHISSLLRFHISSLHRFHISSLLRPIFPDL